MECVLGWIGNMMEDEENMSQRFLLGKHFESFSPQASKLWTNKD